MSTYRVNPKVSDDVIERLQACNLVSQKAKLIGGDTNVLRSEVTYRDFDFLEFLGVSKYADEIANDAIIHLCQQLSIPSPVTVGASHFGSFRKQFGASFQGSWTTITPMMERILYMLPVVRQPKTMIEIGSFWGGTLAWFAGSAIGNDPMVSVDEIIGVEIENDMHTAAIKNFSMLAGTEPMKLICADGMDFLADYSRPIDMLYLEAKSRSEQQHYIQFVEAAYQNLSPGAWVIAHDTTRFLTRNKMTSYLEFVRDKRKFAHSISFDIDNFGLELSIKH